MLDQAQYQRVRETPGPVFFDRGVVDALGMCDAAGVSNYGTFQEVLNEFPFHHTAFIFPPWKDIYTVDAERDQTFEEAVAVDDAVRRWYLRCGFRLVDVPQLDVDARCDFILSQVPGS